MNRREFLQCAAILVSGASVSKFGFSLSEEQQVFLASAPNFNTTAVDYFSPTQRKIVAAMSEVIIPVPIHLGRLTPEFQGISS